MGLIAVCMDCNKAYEDFGLDVTLPNEQWALINLQNDGLLCVQCMVNRADKLGNIISIRMNLLTINDYPDGRGPWINSLHSLPQLYSYVDVSEDGVVCNGELEYTNRAEVGGWYGHFETGFANRSEYLVNTPNYWRYKK